MVGRFLGPATRLAACAAFASFLIAAQPREPRDDAADQTASDSKTMNPQRYAGKSLKQWIALLEDPNPYVRLSAARALGRVGPDAQAAVPALIRSLTERDEFIRSAAAYSLGEIGPGAAEAVPAMIQALETSSYFHQGIIGSAIAGIGPAAVPDLTRLIREKKGFRFPAVEALSFMGPEAKVAAVPILEEMILVQKADVREQAAYALWKLAGRRDVIKVVVGCLGDGEEGARISAAYHLAAMGPEAADAVPALIRALDDPNQAVRNRSAAALGKIGPVAKDAAPILVRSVGRKVHPVFRPDVTKAIAGIGPAAVPALITALGDRDEFTRWIAAESLGMIGPGAKEAVAALAEMTKAPRVAVRVLFAEALWRIARDDRAVPILTRALDDGDANDHWAAMAYLAEIGPAATAAVPALVKILTLSDRFRRPQTAAETLGRIGPGAAAAVPSLEAALDDPDGAIRVAAALALWRIARSEAALRALIRDVGYDLGGPDDRARLEKKAPLTPAQQEMREAGLGMEGHVRIQAARALGEIGPAAKPAVPAVITALMKTPSREPSIAAALGRIGPEAKAAVPALIEVFENGNELEKEAAGEALKAIDPKAAALEGIR